jgi:hypothetical protein
MEGHLEGGKCLAVVSDHGHLSLFVICTSHSRVKIEISVSALYWPIMAIFYNRKRVATCSIRFPYMNYLNDR